MAFDPSTSMKPEMINVPRSGGLGALFHVFARVRLKVFIAMLMSFPGSGSDGIGGNALVELDRALFGEVFEVASAVVLLPDSACGVPSTPGLG